MTDALTSQMEAIETHAIAAGAAVTPKITDVCIGLPVPRGRCGRIWWDGEQDERGGRRYSLNHQLVANRIGVRFFWPVSDATEAAAKNRIYEMRAIAHELRTRILGDIQLGGNSTDLEVENAEAELLNSAGTLYAIVSIPITTGILEYEVAK